MLHFPCGTVRNNISVVLSHQVLQSQDAGTESEEGDRGCWELEPERLEVSGVLPARGCRREAAGWNCGRIQKATRTL